MAVIDIDGALIEYAWFYPPASRRDPASRAPIVFLHHGFGCIADWRTFPSKVAGKTGRSALVYSRAGCGASSALPSPRKETYLHDEARVVLPSLLDRLAVEECHLFGHSDGASIALLFASAFPERTLASVIEAPHVFAEDLTLRGVAALAARYEADPSLRQKLARYHRDPDEAFYSWSRVWLSPAFRDWTIVNELASIRAPLLVIQGAADPYGSMVHAQSIAERAAWRPTIVELAGCGHNPHVEMEAETLRLTAEFLMAGDGEQFAQASR